MSKRSEELQERFIDKYINDLVFRNDTGAQIDYALQDESEESVEVVKDTMDTISQAVETIKDLRVQVETLTIEKDFWKQAYEDQLRISLNLSKENNNNNA